MPSRARSGGDKRSPLVTHPLPIHDPRRRKLGWRMWWNTEAAVFGRRGVLRSGKSADGDFKNPGRENSQTIRLRLVVARGPLPSSRGAARLACEKKSSSSGGMSE